MGLLKVFIEFIRFIMRQQQQQQQQQQQWSAQAETQKIRELMLNGTFGELIFFSKLVFYDRWRFLWSFIYGKNISFSINNKL